MLRTHDVVVADGTFRIVLTPKRRVIAVLDAPQTLLGPIHAAFELDRSQHLPPGVPEHVLTDPSHVTAGIFDDIGHAVSKAAEGAFNTASKVATTVARPAFDVLKHAAGEGAHLIAHATPFLPSATRRQIDHAANVVMRARLGDMTAKQFVRTIASAAKSGVRSAQHVADTLLDASKFVAKVVDVPVMLASQVPGLGNIVKSISPLEKYQQMVSALQKGDFNAIKKMAEQDLSLAQGVVSLIPGVGTGISAAISAGLAALEGGSPIEIAVRAAYGAIPIPPGIRQLTDIVLDTVLSFVAHPHDLSEVGIQLARDRVPAGLPREIFDTLVHLVVKKVPLQKAATSLADHFVQQYAPHAGNVHIEDALKGLHLDAGHAAHEAGPHNHAPPRLVQPLHALAHA
jgi:hypothetical protein